MISLIIFNIVTTILIATVGVYVYHTHKQLQEEIAQNKRMMLGKMDYVERGLQIQLVEQEEDVYLRMMEQEQEYQQRLADQGFSFSQMASGMSGRIEQVKTTLTTQQEMMSKALVTQQEMISQSLVTQQEMMSKALDTQQEYILSVQNSMTSPTSQESVSQESISQESIFQADDILKRANLFAIAYYNAFRDNTPNEPLQWDKVNKHLYIVGFHNKHYKAGSHMIYVFTAIFANLPGEGKYKASDIVDYLVSVFTKGYPSSYYPNPNYLHFFEAELEMNGGSTFESLATTFGALPPDTPFYPENKGFPHIIPKGNSALFNIKTQDPNARRMLDEAIALQSI